MTNRKRMIQVAKWNVKDYVDKKTGEVQLTKLGEMLAAEFDTDDGDETPFEVAIEAADWWERKEYAKSQR